MNESFAKILTEGGKTNSLGRAGEVIDAVLDEKSRLEELYRCLFHEDAWVRMRAADSLEKICRVHPEWIEDYVDRLLQDFIGPAQPSIQWHLAQMYGEVELSPAQRREVIAWLLAVLSSPDVDWIVASNAMQTLAEFAGNGWIGKDAAAAALRVQQRHASRAVVKRADKLLSSL